VETHSRHIYDLFKLYPKITFDSIFANLIAEVREVRRPHITCRSAQDNVDLQELLWKILNEDFYKSDYNQVTKTLLFEEVSYAQAVTVIQNLLDAECFS
jgi:hypothetical protein